LDDKSNVKGVNIIFNNAISAINSKIELFVPGRLCLFGEHSDWSGQMRKFNAEITPGQALVVCTEEGIYATASASNKLKIKSFNNNSTAVFAEYNMELRELQNAASEGGFFSYVAGVAAYILNYHHIGGLNLVCTKMTLPQKKGLSSSAAICTLTARAFNRIYGLNLTTRGEMEAAYGGEQLTPSRCGRLDQAVAYGSGIINMRFDGDRLDAFPVKIGAPLHFVFADLNSSKDTITILRDLNSAYPYPQTDLHNDLHKLLGATNKRIISEVITAIATGDAERIGLLMIASQEQFDKYAVPLSPKELKAPILHRILNNETIRQWIYGGKGVGSQGDGAVQFIAKNAEDSGKLTKYLQQELKLDSYSVIVSKTTAIRKAVIPLAGYGTRMFPATKAIKKEFLPVVDDDNLVKPMLLVLLESLINSGIEDICLVIRPNEEGLYNQFFDTLPDLYLRKLPEYLQQYNEKLSKIGSKISYVYQTEALGFGHAVLQSEQFANGEPVLLMLGDHLFSSCTNKSCISQLIDMYDYSETLTIGLFELSLDDVSNYGIVKIADNGIADNSFKLSALIEKPQQDFAQSELAYCNKYYGMFMYVITQKVYTALAKDFAERDNSSDELPLTPALDSVARKFDAIGVLLDGIRYDIGIPAQYRQTVSEYGK
jgi:UTP-glucose-1-phosphate uridylyltransferase/mevalonate kinase